jgi:hypothetical protein
MIWEKAVRLFDLLIVGGIGFLRRFSGGFLTGKNCGVKNEDKLLAREIKKHITINWVLRFYKMLAVIAEKGNGKRIQREVTIGGEYYHLRSRRADYAVCDGKPKGWVDEVRPGAAIQRRRGPDGRL